jgi:hypothetical protein
MQAAGGYEKISEANHHVYTAGYNAQLCCKQQREFWQQQQQQQHMMSLDEVPFAMLCA